MTTNGTPEPRYWWLPDWVSIPQACNESHLSRSVIEAAITAGEINTKLMPYRQAVYVDRESLLAWMRTHP